jgi:hypothetical protein
MPSFEDKMEAELAAIRSVLSEGRLEEAKVIVSSIALNASPGTRLSQEIGDLYLELGFPAMAGRYWYLMEDKSHEMAAACEEFERSLGNNPVLIREALGWLPEWSPYAKERIEELDGRAKAFRREHQYNLKPARGLGDRIALVGCGLVGFVVLFTLIAGIAFIARGFK